MRWVAKALLQKGLSALPQPERTNYLLQRYVSRSLPVPHRGLERRFERAEQHVRAYRRHGPGRPLGEAVFYEFGAGWDLGVPLAFWALGVEHQILVDLRPNLRLDLVNTTVARLNRTAGERADLRSLGPPVDSLDRLEKRFGIRYLAPRDARATGLPAGSVDFVSSTSTLEHVPSEDVVPILSECRRLLRPDGALSCRIDLSDHFSHFDKSISPYNFLRFDERTWGLLNSALLHQNRLRRSDYVRALERAGFVLASEKPWAPKDDDPLAGVRPAERFRAYEAGDLAVQKLRLVAKPSPDALEELNDVVR